MTNVELKQEECEAMDDGLWYLQYKSIDGLWYDSSAYDTLEAAIAMYEKSGRKESYRVVERTDRTVWPLPIDPASQGGA